MIGYKPDTPKSPTEREMAEFLIWLDDKRKRMNRIDYHFMSDEDLIEIVMLDWDGFDLETRYHMEVEDDPDMELEFFLLGLGYEC